MRLPALSKIVVGSHPNTNADALPEGFLEELENNPNNKSNTWQVSITFSILYLIVPVNSNLFKQGIVHSIEHDKLMQNVQNHYSSWMADGGFFLIAIRMTDCDEKGQGGEKLGLKICKTKLGAPRKGFETFDLMDLVGLEVFDTLFGAMFTFQTHGKYGDYGSPGLARELLADSKQFEQLFDSKTRCRIPTNATCFAPPGIPRTALNRLDATTCLFSYVCYAPGFRGVELSRTMTLGQIQRVFIVDGLRANLLQGMSLEQAKVSFREFWRANYMQIGQGSEVFEAASNAPLDAFLKDPVNFTYPPFQKREKKKKKRKRRNDDRAIVINDDDVDAEFDNSASQPPPPPRQRRRTNVSSAQTATQTGTAAAQTGVNIPPASSSSSTQAAQPNAPILPAVTYNVTNITLQAAPQGVQSLMAQAPPQLYQNSQAATAASLLQAFLPSASTAFSTLPSVATTPPINTVASYIQQQQNSLGIQALGQLGLLGQGLLGQGLLGQGMLGQGMLGQGMLGHGMLGQGMLGQGMLGQDWSNKAVPQTGKSCREPWKQAINPTNFAFTANGNAQSKPPKKRAKIQADLKKEYEAALKLTANDRQVVVAPSADSRVVEQSKPPKKQAKKRVYMAHYKKEIEKLNLISRRINSSPSTDDRQVVAAPSAAGSRQNASRLQHIVHPGQSSRRIELS